MRRSLLSVVPVAAVVAVGLAGLTATSASASPAAPSKGVPAVVAHDKGAPSPKVAALPTAPLRGYTQVTSAQLVDGAGVQTSGSAVCPVGTKVVGGGAVISSSSLTENLNGSLPLSDGRTWRVYVNNASTTDGTFFVYATCAKRVESYSVVLSSPTTAPAGQQTTASVSCPTGTVPLGGGGDGSSSAVTVNLNTSIPTTTGWRIDLNNASPNSDNAFASVVCGVAPNAYKQVSNTVAAKINAGTQGSATVSCPSGRTVLSGGAFSSSGSTTVNLNSSLPTSTTSWRAYENNSSSGQTTLKAYAVCVKTL